ncbi:MAG: hypothetical protein WAN93_10810 [Solirubrobacteraceae bacterium]
MTQARHQVDQLTPSGIGTGIAVEARVNASAALAHAHARLLTALDESRTAGKDTVSELIADAVELVRALPVLWLSHTSTGYEDRLPMIAQNLERQLSAHEHGVLSGERTYALSVADAEEPAVRMRRSLAELASHETAVTGDLISVQIAAIELATLPIRAAGNLMTHNRATGAPERRTEALDRTLMRIEREVSSHARALAHEEEDEVGHHLTQALRLDPPTRPPRPGTADRERLHEARGYWLELAAHEHAAALALARNLPEPSFRSPYETLDAAITGTAAEVICEARLLPRAEDFRHEEAWKAQSNALTQVREFYANGLPGSPNGLKCAQAILLTRLVRAIIAITVIDSQPSAPQHD